MSPANSSQPSPLRSARGGFQSDRALPLQRGRARTEGHAADEAHVENDGVLLGGEDVLALLRARTHRRCEELSAAPCARTPSGSRAGVAVMGVLLSLQYLATHWSSALFCSDAQRGGRGPAAGERAFAQRAPQRGHTPCAPAMA